jgi:predicted lipoprotein with Yx(FWY)xxD motif
LRKLPTLLLVPVSVLAIAACGSSHKSTTSTATSPPATTTTTAPAPAAPAAPAATTTTATTKAPATTTPAAAATGPKISSATISKLGPVLVNAQGHTLYIFAPDNDKKVTCTGGCAAVWPPASLPAGEKPAASGSVKQSLLASDPNPSGGQVITYAGWPLYAYVADSAAGVATGQAIDLSGGLWYVISPSGKVIKTKP